MKYHSFLAVVIILVCIFILRIVVGPSFIYKNSLLMKLIPYFSLGLVTLSWVLSEYQLVLFYPVMVNVALFVLFLFSVLNPPSIVEQIARLSHPNLPEKGVRYTKKVTVFWCCFFIINAAISLLTCLLNDIELWTLYNGLLSYILIGIFMGGEWIIRKRLQH